MNLVTGVIQSILGNALALLTFALLTKIATGYEADQLSTSKLQNYQYTTVPYAHNNADHSNLHSNQLSDDEVKLNIIENEIRNFAKILMPYTETYKRQRNKRSTPSSNTTLASNTPSRFTTIENQISQLQENLTNLKKDVGNQNQTRITELEGIIAELQKSLDILSKELTDRDKIITVLTQKLNTEISIGIVQSIQLRQFALADQQLKLSNDISVEDIVELSYNNTDDFIGNIDSLQSFGEYISGAERKLKFFQTLLNRMRTNDRGDVYILVRQVKSLKRDVLGHVANATAAQSLFDTLGDVIQAKAIELISANFLNGNSGPDITYVSATLVDNFPQLAQTTYDKVIEKISNALDIEKIINEAEKIYHLESKMSVHHAIFRKLERTNTLNTNPSITLARSMKEIMKDNDYQNVSSSWKSTYESMINKLPQLVKNLVFSSTICIKNLYFDEYLYAPHIEYGDSESYSERRSVYTWIPQNRTESLTFKWRINFTGDRQIEFVNEEFEEKLCSSDYRTSRYNPGKVIYTFRIIEEFRIDHWTEDSSTGDLPQWNLSVYSSCSFGTGLKFKNVLMNKTLFADRVRTENNKMRHVSLKEGECEECECVWEIIDCSPRLCNAQLKP